ncbi:MAG: SPOR domain-containing protein [Paracoccaceae bacterium]|nr:SPOR domain-containing protein [Paracoccaceae bacterium]
MPAQPPASSIPARNFVPKGYYSLLDDAGTRALRGVGTAQGQAAMDLIWTETVPRRLIDVTTGRDVTARYPQIRYPYQTASLRPYVPAGAVGRHHTRKRAYRHRKATTSQTCSCVCKPAEVVCTPKVKQGKKPRIKDEAAPANMKYYHKVNDVSATNADMHQGRKRGVLVQVATFGVPANATRTIARFRSAGMPVLSRPLRRGGKSYDIVMLGPFTDAASLARALKAARGAGFSDAFTLRR